MRKALSNALALTCAFIGVACAPCVLASEPPEVNPQLQWSRTLRPAINLRENVLKQPAPIRHAIPASENEEILGKVGKSDSPAQLPNTWSILISDKTLYRTMRRWTQEANYQLIWQVDRDYPIEANVEFKNSFRAALEQVMEGVALTDYPLQAIVNPSARVLRVVRHQDDGRR